MSKVQAPLYQVWVETRGGDCIPVGPKLVRGAAEQILIGIKQLIASGKEQEWGNPHLNLAQTLH